MLPANRPPTHPGEMLLKEFLEPLGVSQVEAAERMNIPFQRLNGHREGPPRRQRRHRAVAAGTHPVGRRNLAESSGQVGPVPGAGEPRAAAKGAGLTEDRLTEFAWAGPMPYAATTLIRATPRPRGFFRITISTS
jgi:hypothetical protein